VKARIRKASTRVDAERGRTIGYGGAGAVITPEVYARARVAYLEHGTPQAVREATGLRAEAVARLIDSGEPRLHLPSLRDAARVAAAAVSRELARVEKGTAEEQAQTLARSLEARAKAARQAREHEAKVLGDAVASRADEVLLVRANRKSALALAAINADLLRAGTILSRSLLEDPKALARLSPRERLGLLRTIAGVVHRTAQASQVAVSMERLLMGEPTAILGRADGTGPSTADMTPEEAEQWLALANRAFARRAGRRTLVDVETSPSTSREDDVVDELVEDL
jgi:hypothetical protein